MYLNKKCDDIPASNFTSGYNFIDIFPRYERPCFNPNNSAEFVCQINDGTSDSPSIFIYNLETNERTLLYKGGIYGIPDWGKNGWILLNPVEDPQIWKIKSNGDSLTQLTSEGTNLTPYWNPNADKIIFATSILKEDPPGNSVQFAISIIMDSDGNHIDTLPGNTSLVSWHDSNRILFFGGNIILEDLENQTRTTIIELERPFSSSGITSINMDEFIWCNNEGVFTHNMISGNTELIKEACESRVYELPSYSPQSGKLLFTRREANILQKQNTYESYYKIVEMNIDGSEERVVMFD